MLLAWWLRKMIQKMDQFSGPKICASCSITGFPVPVSHLLQILRVPTLGKCGLVYLHSRFFGNLVQPIWLLLFSWRNMHQHIWRPRLFIEKYGQPIWIHPFSCGIMAQLIWLHPSLNTNPQKRVYGSFRFETYPIRGVRHLTSRISGLWQLSVHSAFDVGFSYD